MGSTGICRNVKKNVSLSQDFGNWRKTHTMILDLMAGLYNEVWSTFVTFNMSGTGLQLTFLTFYMPNRQYLIR